MRFLFTFYIKDFYSFSLSRTDTTESSAGLSPASRSNSGDSNTPGFPKVLPAPGATALVQRRRSTLEALVPQLPGRRPGSFRVRSPKTPQERKLNFCCRRQSWPEIDHQVRSGYETLIDTHKLVSLILFTRKVIKRGANSFPTLFDTVSESIEFP